MMRSALRLTLLTAALVLATYVLGWWAPAAVGVAWATLGARSWRAPGEAALGALFAWFWLLAGTGTSGQLRVLAEITAEIFRVPALALLAATVLFGALLAGSAAMLVVALRPGLTARQK